MNSSEDLNGVSRLIIEVWENRSNNMVGTYDSVLELARDLKQSVETHGNRAIDSLSLSICDPDGTGYTFAHGTEEIQGFLKKVSA